MKAVSKNLKIKLKTSEAVLKIIPEIREINMVLYGTSDSPYDQYEKSISEILCDSKHISLECRIVIYYAQE